MRGMPPYPARAPRGPHCDLRRMSRPPIDSAENVEKISSVNSMGSLTVHGCAAAARSCLRRAAGALPALLAALVLLAAWPAAARAGFDSDNKFQPGDAAPDFTLQDVSGREVTLSSFKGEKVVLLAFFALRCSTCLAESPHLEELHSKYGGKDVVVLAVNTDGVGGDLAARTMKDVGFNVTYTVLVDPEFAVTDTYTNFLVPLTIVIDRKGIIRFFHTGYEKGAEKQYEKALKKALGS